MSTVEPVARLRVSESRIERNPDGTHYTEPPSGAVRVTHDDLCGADLFLIDTPAGLLTDLPIEDVADLHAALGRMLDFADPHHINRRRAPQPTGQPATAPCLAALYRRTELEARAVARTYTPAAVAAFVGAGPILGADPHDLAVYARAETILAGPVHGPDNAPSVYRLGGAA